MNELHSNSQLLVLNFAGGLEAHVALSLHPDLLRLLLTGAHNLSVAPGETNMGRDCGLEFFKVALEPRLQLCSKKIMN